MPVERSLDVFFDLAPGLMIQAGFDGFFARVNPEFVELSGYTEQELLSTPFIEFVWPEDRPQFAEQFARMMAGADVRHLEFRVLLKDGNYRWFLSNIRVVGEHVYGFAVDLTDRKRAEQAEQAAKVEAERANMAKSDFLSRMSHELRTPLNVVLGFGQILEMRGSLTDRDGEAVEQILKAGRHLLELINEVLDLSRIESGRMAISPEPVAIAELAGEALDLIRPLAHERTVRLTADLGACHRHVTADRQRLKQVLLNLLSNAVKYNRDGGEVAVSCAEGAPGRLRLQVKDTGPGIPAALMDRLFEPFERLGAELGHVEGTGLGLALSRQLVELMGGEIGAESREDEGSVFWIELDIAHPPGTAGPAPRGAAEDNERLPRRPGHRRVLLIEDNLANLKVIQNVMAGRAYVELVPAMTGRLGLELAREHRPDLILLDQHLPDVTGDEVLHRLKADTKTRGIPVVVVSADATPGRMHRMLELGAADCLTKPLDMPSFLNVVDRILERDGPAA
jgi:PAS domain S-box-containing protein